MRGLKCQIKHIRRALTLALAILLCERGARAVYVCALSGNAVTLF